jgi:hypothetical protein
MPGFALMPPLSGKARLCENLLSRVYRLTGPVKRSHRLDQSAM